MTEIYIACITPFYDGTLFEKMCELLSEERKRRMEKYRMQKDKCRSLGAGLLLEYGLRQHGYSLLEKTDGKTQVRLAKGAYGKPYIEGVPLYFNLSHSGEYAAAVFGEAEAGIDIEKVRSANLKLAGRFFSEEEYTCLMHTKKEEQDREFTELWTKKESYIKAVGRGMDLPLHDFSVISGEIPFATWDKPEGYCLSVCGQEAAQTHICEIDLQKVFEEG